MHRFWYIHASEAHPNQYKTEIPQRDHLQSIGILKDENRTTEDNSEICWSLINQRSELMNIGIVVRKKM